jgi:hypothetical protein
MNITQLADCIRTAWSPTTAYPGSRKEWTPDVPAIGQCAVTALVVQDYLGGEIVVDRRYHHYWNRLPDGQYVDLTKDQFPPHVQRELRAEEVVERTDLLLGERAEAALTPTRYDALASRVYQLRGR